MKIAVTGAFSYSGKYITRRLLARGEEVILTQEGQPVAKIIAVTRRASQRQFGSAKGLIHMREDFDDPIEDFRPYM